WVFTFLAWISLWAAAGALGYPLSLAIGPVAFLITSTLFFPVLLLSAMEADSHFVPYSPPVLRTLATYWHGWLMFYLLSCGTFAGGIVAFNASFQAALYSTIFLSGPVLAAMMLVYARLLGRLAWHASGAPAAPAEEPGGGPRRKTARRSRKTGPRIPHDLPEHWDGLAHDVDELPTRISFRHRP